MKYLYDRDILLESITYNEYSDIEEAFKKANYDLSDDKYSIENIKQPKLTKKLSEDLNQLKHYIYAYKDGRKNVYFILDYSKNKIVKEQVSGDYKKFVSDFILEKVGSDILESIMDVYTIRKYKSDSELYYVNIDVLNEKEYLYHFIGVDVYTKQQIIIEFEKPKIIFKIRDSKRKGIKVFHEMITIGYVNLNNIQYKKVYDHVVNNKEKSPFREYLFY